MTTKDKESVTLANSSGNQQFPQIGWDYLPNYCILDSNFNKIT